MARLSFDGLSGLEEELKNAGMLDGSPVVTEMLTAGAEEVKKAWRSTAEAHGFVDTGAMVNSIGYKEIGEGYVDIFPQGKDKKTGVRNAEKAFYLHYGWSKFRATHWVDEAEEKAKAPAEAAMKAVWDKYNSTK